MAISKDSFDVDATQVRSFNIVIDLCAYLEKDICVYAKFVLILCNHLQPPSQICLRN